MARSTRRFRRGSDAIEFALVVPVLVALIFGIMEYGWYFNQRIAITAATHDAVRAGATTPEGALDSPEEVAERALAHALDDYGYSGRVYTWIDRVGSSPYERIEVAVALPYRPITGFVPTPDKLLVRQSMRLETQEDNS